MIDVRPSRRGQKKPRAPVAAAMFWAAAMTWGLACGGGCQEEQAAAEPVKVGATDGQQDGPELPFGDAQGPNLPSDVPGGDTPGGEDAAGAGAVPGGLWVLDAKNNPVGVLVQRGHPHRGDTETPDLLQDGVLVYAPGAGLFFGLSMAKGEVLVPRLGIMDSSCDLPLVAGYYAAGPEISGMDYGFAWRGSWYRVAAGAAVKLVQCAGVTKQGVLPKCVLHSGSCRGFPVEKISPNLPLVFPAPMKFVWKGALP